MNPQERALSPKITVTFPTKEIYFRKLTVVSTPTITEISTIFTKESEPIPKKQLQPQPIPQPIIQEQTQPEELVPKIFNQFDINRYGCPNKGNTLMHRSEYSLEYDTRLRNATWVCEHLFQTEVINKRNNTTRGTSVFNVLIDFREDEDITVDFRAKLSDYRESKYDRGHLTPAANHKSSQESMNETFLLSNMSPQVGNGFNRHYWARFEDFSRQLLKDWKDVFICTGGLYIPKEITMNDNTKKYVVEYEVIGNPPTVAVPTHFYKIILADNSRKNETNNTDNNESSNEEKKPIRALATFIIPNKPIHPDEPLENYIVHKRTLESYAGTIFFPKLLETSDVEVHNLCTLSRCVLPLPWRPASKDSAGILTSQIEAFQVDDKIEKLEFPVTLSAGERAIVHKEAQSRGLGHYTVGANEERRVIVEKLKPEKVESPLIQEQTS